MQRSFISAFYKNFLGNSPEWYKLSIISFLIINPILFFLVDPYTAGWALVIEFIFTLAMALKCYPLQPGGLLAIEAVFIGMTSPAQVMHEMVPMHVYPTFLDLLSEQRSCRIFLLCATRLERRVLLSKPLHDMFTEAFHVHV